MNKKEKLLNSLDGLEMSFKKKQEFVNVLMNNEDDSESSGAPSIDIPFITLCSGTNVFVKFSEDLTVIDSNGVTIDTSGDYPLITFEGVVSCAIFAKIPFSLYYFHEETGEPDMKIRGSYNLDIGYMTSEAIADGQKFLIIDESSNKFLSLVTTVEL